MNMMRTFILMAALTALFIGIGYLIGGPTGMVIALIVAFLMNIFAYWNSDSVVLRMYRAREVTEADAPQYYRIVKQLAGNAGLPMPRVYIVENPQPNAFATGRDPDHAAVCATSGLIQMLTPEELAGVMAHELGHVRNRDTLTMTVTATIAGAISMLTNFALFFGGGRRNNGLGLIGTLALMFLAPIAAGLVQMAISRTREFAADRAGAEISGHPLWLASALGKISDGAARVDNMDAERNPATAHMFIINPLHGHSFDALFSTHPSTDDRIVRLQQMAGEFAQSRDTGPWS